MNFTEKIKQNKKVAIIIGIVLILVIIYIIAPKKPKDEQNTKSVSSNTEVTTEANSSVLTDEIKNGEPEHNTSEYVDYLALKAKEDAQTATIEISTESTTEKEVESSVEEPTETESLTEKEEITLGMRNALSKAKDYLNYTAFSYTGLIKQLEYEGYSNEEATYGADNCGADWNEQAAKKAQSYLDYTSFSRQGLIDQLIYEGFTEKQAEYGVDAVGY